MRYVFILNPVAGKGKATETVIPMVEEYFSGDNSQHKIYITEKAGDAKSFAEAEAISGDDIVVFACGGEGTCFEVLNGIVKYPNAAFGIIPCGSANDFLKLFNLNAPFLDIESQINGTLTPIDLIKCDEDYCFNGCSVGIDAVVAKDMSIFKNWKFVTGSMAYKLAIVKNFFFSRLGINLRITLDGKNVRVGNYLFAVCSNGSTYGGGYLPAPLASPEDGKLNFTLIKKINRLRVLSFLKYYEKGDFERFSFAETGDITVMSIEAKKPFAVNRDGEITMKQNVRFELIRRGVRFLVPKGAVKKYEETLNFAKST